MKNLAFILFSTACMTVWVNHVTQADPQGTTQANVQVRKVITAEENAVPSKNAAQAMAREAIPVINWSKLEGQVTRVDQERRIMELRLRGTNDIVGIPVVPELVGIFKSGDHQYALKDIRPGDSVTVRNSAM
jgi:hypothetical protein